MPVFARLSSRFYEVVGEDVAQQLVDWLNAVEEEMTGRARLRLHNELLHARAQALAPGFQSNAAEILSNAPAFRSNAPDSMRSVEARMHQGSVIQAELRRFRSDLIWWMFVSCTSTLLGTLVLLILLR